MVHEKKKSGDPDYDDKVPMAEQVGETVTAPDGQPVRLTESNGPLDAQGAHINLDPQPEQDNRPAPGSVATEVSEVQVASPLKETAPKPAKGTSSPK